MTAGDTVTLILLLAAAATPPILAFLASRVLVAIAVPRTHVWRRRIEIVFLTVALVLGFQFWTFDGFTGFVFGVVGAEDTEYAPGYSWFGFWLVSNGMSMERVRSLAGAPLEEYDFKDEPGAVVWRWARSPGDTDYRCRAIGFKNGVVAWKHTEYYVD